MSETKETDRRRGEVGVELNYSDSGRDVLWTQDWMNVLGLTREKAAEAGALVSSIIKDGSVLGRRRAELTATLVGILNGSHICRTFHGESLRDISDYDHLVYHLEHDYTLLELDDQEREMLEFAATLLLAPGRLDESDVQSLYTAGFTENELIELVTVISLCSLNNRLSAAQGADIESDY